MSRVEQSNKMELDRIVFVGRTFDEYMKIFSLTLDEMKGKRILDCPSGACSFTAVANHSGFDVTACDIAYHFEVEDLKRKGYQDIEHAMKHVETDKLNYVWEYFKDIDALKSERLHALNDCCADMLRFSNRYIPVTLPVLPFRDEAFDLVLSAHFLFMYADRLDYDFHITTINELLRVSKEEIRIFPLVDLAGNRYEHIEKIKAYLQNIGCITEEIKVPYEFQRNANSMLQVRKG